jgi:hypothetical protein
VGRRLEALEVWDPAAGERGGLREYEDWQAQMAQDPEKSLHRAEAAAQEALALARSPAEAYRANEALALIECNRGHHAAELRAARRLMALDPQNERSLYWLRRAARCNGLRLVEQHVDRELSVQLKGEENDDTKRNGLSVHSLGADSAAPRSTGAGRRAVARAFGGDDSHCGRQW